jgi:hypothetical protein
MDKIILNEQGYQVKGNSVYRNNQAAMKLEMNGKTSSGKRTRHFDIKYFFMNDLINWNEIKIEFCPKEVYQMEHKISSDIDIFTRYIR